MSSPALLFQQLRWRLFRNALAIVLAHSWLRVVSVASCCAFIWIILFGLSWYGFHELRARWLFHLDGNLMEMLFNLFFLSLTILLIFSTGIILYSGLFAGPESEYLLALPIPDDQVFSYKLQGAVAFSSWAFVLLGSPVLLAYGLEVGGGAPWYYYAVLPLFFLGFLLIPGSIGSLLCLLVVNLIPLHRSHLLIGSGLVLTAAGIGGYGAWWYQETKELGVGSQTWFQSLLYELSFLGGRLVPYHWMSRGLRYAAIRRPEEMVYYLGLVWSNGLFLYIVTVWLARKLYRRGYNRLASGGTLRKRYGGHWVDRLVSRLLFFVDAQTQILIVKDFRTFRRDPAQWFQIVIFLGLGCIYFFIMRYYEPAADDDSKKQSLDIYFNWISLLTLTAASFLMCAYTGRFIYPMLSLEGKKFWILGLLPLDRSRLMIGKFVFSSIGCLFAGEFLIGFSNIMLGRPWLIVVTHMLAIGLIAFVLSGLSVGLGACMPNFRESDPSKIAVGFGGTVNLVVCLLVLGVLIGTVALPLHVLYWRNPEGTLSLGMVPWYDWLCMLAGACVGVAAIWLPMRAGIRNLRSLEF